MTSTKLVKEKLSIYSSHSSGEAESVADHIGPKGTGDHNKEHV